MTVQVQAAGATAVAMIITFWTGTLLVIYNMINTSYSAMIFIYGLAFLIGVGVWNLASTGGRKVVR